jgi:carboxypeptidase Q
VAAIESDSGVFRPVGFSSPEPTDDRERRIRHRLEQMVELLEPVGADTLRNGGGGADIGPMKSLGVPQLGLRVEGRLYFDYHHTAADTFDKVVKEELDLCVGVLAALAFVIADNPERLDAE